jgi:hypothetical protein
MDLFESHTCTNAAIATLSELDATNLILKGTETDPYGIDLAQIPKFGLVLVVVLVLGL